MNLFVFLRFLRIFGVAIGCIMATFGAFAQNDFAHLKIIGQPESNGMSLQPPATELMRDALWFDNFLLIIISIITAFVMVLLVWVILRYNRRINPEPATFTHNTPIEVVWTVIPIAILVLIGTFSVPLLFKQQVIPEADVTIRATGHQWYWSYEYPDHGIEFESYMLQKDALAEHGYSQDAWLLATDQAVIIPSGKTIVVQVKGADVIHSWTVPAFGVKQDGVPGRIGELWFEVDEGMEGIYFGQCSELCGKDHTYMPITVKVVTAAEYDAWLKNQI